MTRTRLGILALSMLISGTAASYEMETHYDLMFKAVQKSALADRQEAMRLGLRSVKREFPSTDDPEQEFPKGCRYGRHFPADVLIACGAEFEDLGFRAFNHFFEPVSGIPLKVKIPFVGLVPPGNLLNKPDFPSPDWALEDVADIPEQQFSYKDARDHFYLAMTLPVSTAAEGVARDGEWGAGLQTLGQVIHHIQDMAQPQHVRNDQHVDRWYALGFYNPSFYEQYTATIADEPLLVDLMSGAAANAVYSADNPTPFELPRDFWVNPNFEGMAEYTNSNMLSAGTNFEMYEGSPVPDATYPFPLPGMEQPTVMVTELVPAPSDRIMAYCAAVNKPQCTMTFYSTNENTQHQNLRASAYSIFDEKVRLRTAFNDRNGPPYSSAGPKLRRSLWNGKRITLSRFQGTPEAYASMLGGILTGVSWGRCGWTKLPRMVLALDREASRIQPTVGVMRIASIPTIDAVRDVAKGTPCENVDAILKEYK